MNIIFFTSNYPKSYSEPIISGMVKNPFYLSQALDKAGHQITIITNGEKKGDWNFEGVQVFCVGRGFLKGVVNAFFVELKMLFKYLSIYKKKNFDVIHIHHLNLFFLILLKKLKMIKCPVFYTAQGTSTPELYASFRGFSFFKLLLYLNGKIQHLIDALCWKNAETVISPSKFQVEEMKALYHVPEQKIQVIYNGIEPTRYFPDLESGRNLKRQLEINENTSVVLYVGRIARKKGIHLIIENAKNILRELPETRFLLILGNIGRQLDYRNEIIDLIEKESLDKYMIIRENVPEKDLPSYYHASDLCVFPSQGYESIPTVLYEAMACGKPIITQGSWGITEILDEVILSEKDFHTTTFFRTVVKVLKNNEFRKMISHRNLQKIKEFHWDKIQEQHLDLYKSFLENTKNV